MDQVLKTRLERNIRLYAWMKTFTKRVYFPVVAILLAYHAHLSIEQIGFIGVMAAVVQGVLQLPTGYIADKLGNRATMLCGAVIALPAALFYVFMPNFWGGLLGLCFYSAGGAFISGASEALMHDTLTALGRAHDYAKEVGRAQSIALVGNFVLLSLIPMTYAIDFRLPFILGFAASALLTLVIMKMVEPRVADDERRYMSPLNALHKVITPYTVPLFIFAGLTGGVVERGFDFLILSLQQVGVADYLSGIVVAISSLLGAVFGWYIHVFDHLKPKVFYLLDLLIVTGLFALCGVKQMAFVVPALVILLGYIRVRYIVFQSKVLQEIDHHYKASLVSALGFFSIFGGIFTLVIFGKLSKIYGFMDGLLYFSGIVALVGVVLFIPVALRGQYVAHKAPVRSEK